MTSAYVTAEAILALRAALTGTLITEAMSTDLAVSQATDELLASGLERAAQFMTLPDPTGFDIRSEALNKATFMLPNPDPRSRAQVGEAAQAAVDLAVVFEPYLRGEPS